MRNIIILSAFVFFLKNSYSQELTATQIFPEALNSGKTYIIEAIIKKGTITGFMKFAQELSEGIVATENENVGGSFSFVDNTAKIVWVAPPIAEEFKISYKITIPQNNSGKIKFTGKISYINNNERIIYELASKEIIIDGMEQTFNKSEEKKEEIIVQNKKVENKKIIETKEKTQQLPPTSKIPVTAAPISLGKTYRVQIGAFSQKPKIESVPEISTIVLENGITKYFSGNFESYEDANKRKKEMIEQGFAGAFIVQFENGKIIK